MINPNRTKGEVMFLKRSLMFALLFCFALVSPCLAKKGDSKIMAEVKTVMEQHNKAFNAQDLKGVMTNYASDPNTVLMGTGPGEAYAGDEAIGGAYNQLFTRFEANSLSFKYDWISVRHTSEGKRQMADSEHALFQAGCRATTGC
jgi:hypothetical protein